MLARVFAGQRSGFYIDVGAWHPTYDSVTRHFYDSDWSGINLEPIPQQHALFLRDRPRDTNLRVAAADTTEQRTFYDFSPAGGISTFDAATAARMRERGFACREYAVEVTTLAEICRTQAVKEVDFLKIDVEGAERQVLLGADWARVRPRVVVVEATRPMETVPAHESWEPILLANGYLFAYFDGLNRFYVRREDAGLLERLRVPPNYFDDFQPARVHDLELQLRRWRRTTVRGIAGGVWRRLSRLAKRERR